jgi:hypothetical protein
MGSAMTFTSTKRALAILALGALAACNGGVGSGVPIPNSSPKPIVTPASGVPLVGVGDSLTAGYQSSGFLGATNVTSAASNYPPYPSGNGAVPPGQENGWWAIMYDCMNSASTGTCAHTPVSYGGSVTANASGSVLPLIAGPGLGNQLVLNGTTLIASSQTSNCTTFDDEAFSSTAWAATRLNPTATVLDLGVPGITMHEALAMSGPLTGPPSPSTCSYASNPNDPTAGALQALVSGESSVFYPVMGSYQANFKGSNLTMLNVAAGLHGKITTVWLGANDLLTYIFSNAKSPVTDTPQQLTTDLQTIVKTLTASGSKVLVADLPTVLQAPQFFPYSKLTNDFTVLLTASLVAQGTPVAQAQAAAASYAQGVTQYLTSTYSLSSGSYLTETGFLTAATEAGGAIAKNPAAPDFTAIDLNATGLGPGQAYLTTAFAAQVSALNAAYNAAIDAVASGSGSNVALVPINATFTSLATNGLTLAPGETATLQFGGGLVSWDGLHPSNLGYAVIANTFIGTADTAFGMTIPPLSNAQIGQIASSDPYDPFVIKALNPNSPFPLP